METAARDFKSAMTQVATETIEHGQPQDTSVASATSAAGAVAAAAVAGGDGGAGHDETANVKPEIVE
jgi:hypothetical protein